MKIVAEFPDGEIVINQFEPTSYQEAYSQARELAPIDLMAAVIMLLLCKDPQPRQATYANLNKFLERLPPCRSLGRGDLLAVFIDQMEALVEQGHLERNETYERAPEFVRELQKRREALETSGDEAAETG